MASAEMLMDQMAGENSGADELLLLDSRSNDSFVTSSLDNLAGDNTSKLSRLPGSQLDPPHFGQYGCAVDPELYTFTNPFAVPEPDPTISSYPRLRQVDGLTTPPGTLSPEDKPETSDATKSRSRKTKQQSSTETTNNVSPKTRRQPKRSATKNVTSIIANNSNNNTGSPVATSTKRGNGKRQTRRERSLERNRVAASKCRRRKKDWTEKLEQKKAGLEALHRELQAEYLTLLQESSHLKNYLISHAGCQDPNIDVWVHDEASKYARRLSGENPQRLDSIHSLPSLENGSTSKVSSANSPCTEPSHSSPVHPTEDFNDGDLSGDDEFILNDEVEVF